MRRHNESDDDEEHEPEVAERDVVDFRLSKRFSMMMNEVAKESEAMRWAIELNEAGLGYAAKGQWDDALAAYNEALADVQKQAPNSVFVAKVHNNIGVVHASRGDYRTCMKHYLRSLQMIRECIGEGNLDIASVYSNIGDVHFKEERYPEAFHNFSRAEAILVTLRDTNSLSYAECNFKLGCLHKHREEYAEALDRLQRSLELQRNLLGDSSVEYADTLFQLATVRHKLKDAAAALSLLTKALALYTTIHGEKHASIADCHHNLGIACADTKDTERAFQHFSLAASLRQELGIFMWMPDKHARACHGCHARFTVTFRKHHCRQCGIVYCSKCTAKSVVLPDSSKPVRVCERCYTKLAD